MTNNYKLCFIDVETTGLDAKKNDIYQLGMKITDPDLKLLDTLSLEFRPHDSKNVDPEALRRCGRSVGEVNSFGLSSKEAFDVTLQLLNTHVNRFDKKDKMHFVAYNAGFDTDFVREWFLKNKDSYYGSFFFHPSICVMQAMAWYTQSVRGVLPNFQLGTMCKCAELGWDEAQSHDATYDITKTMELYAYLREQTPVL